MPVLAVPAILVVGTVAAVGAAAVLAVRAADAAGAAAAEGLIRLDEAMLRRSAQYWDAQQRSDMWQCAAHAALARNAEIRVLRAAAASHGLRGGPDLPIPPLLDMAGKTIEQVHEWCKTVDHRLAEAQRAYDEKVAASAWATVAAELRLPDAAPSLRQRGARLEELAARHRSAGRRPIQPAGPRRAPTEHEVAAVLAQLGPEVEASGLARAQAAAALVLEEQPVTRAQGRLDQLVSLVQTLREPVARADRLEAARVLEAIRTASALPTFLAPDDDLVSALTAVAAGTRRLTPELRSAADVARRHALDAAQRAYLAEVADQLFTEREYQVIDGQSTQQGATVRILSRVDLPHHVVHVVIDGDEIRGATVRRNTDDHSELNEADSAACTVWAEDLRAVADGLVARQARIGQVHVVQPQLLETTTTVWERQESRNDGEDTQRTRSRPR